LGATGLELAAPLAPLLGAGAGDPDFELAGSEDPDDELGASEEPDDDPDGEPSLAFDGADSFTLDASSFDADEERDFEVRLSFL
jgi:hypothetical protein